jgi:hypothetical protein
LEFGAVNETACTVMSMNAGHAMVAAVGFVTVALSSGCGSSTPPTKSSDVSIKEAVVRGVSEIGDSEDRKRLEGRLVQTLTRLRATRASTAVDRRARRLAIEGFAATLQGVKSERAFYERDSGNLPAATRDATRAYRSRKRGANFLRAAGRALGIRIGSLDGY